MLTDIDVDLDPVNSDDDDDDTYNDDGDNDDDEEEEDNCLIVQWLLAVYILANIIGILFIFLFVTSFYLSRVSPELGQTVVGFNISVTNDARTYSEAVTMVKMDSVCLHCRYDGSSCTVKVSYARCSIKVPAHVAFIRSLFCLNVFVIK